jgi:hypothetical protein
MHIQSPLTGAVQAITRPLDSWPGGLWKTLGKRSSERGSNRTLFDELVEAETPGEIKSTA